MTIIALQAIIYAAFRVHVKPYIGKGVTYWLLEWLWTSAIGRDIYCKSRVLIKTSGALSLHISPSVV